VGVSDAHDHVERHGLPVVNLETSRHSDAWPGSTLAASIATVFATAPVGTDVNARCSG
jgi:hypothetical protein